jgi:hypothetical protein
MSSEMACLFLKIGSKERTGRLCASQIATLWWDHNLYRMLSNANTKGADAEFASDLVNQGVAVFSRMCCIVSDCHKPDVHAMEIVMFHHLQKQIFPFMKMHEELDKYKPILLSVPSYHDLTPNNTSYEGVFQWNGKEMKDMSP